MLAAAYGTLSDIEVAWTVVALVGLIVTCFNLREAIKDYRFLQRNEIFNGRRLVARVALKTEMTRVYVQSVFLSIGIAAGFVPEAPSQLDQPWAILVIGFLVRWGLITAAILIAMQSVWLRRLRTDLIKEGHA